MKASCSLVPRLNKGAVLKATERTFGFSVTAGGETKAEVILKQERYLNKVN